MFDTANGRLPLQFDELWAKDSLRHFCGFGAPSWY